MGNPGYALVPVWPVSGDASVESGNRGPLAALSSTGGLPMGNGAEARKTFHYSRMSVTVLVVQT